ncbi:MAG TPA: response regulator [Burkholderiales bacterium]|nr:response regulator [Burkholderiales bacterium]
MQGAMTATATAKSILCVDGNRETQELIGSLFGGYQTVLACDAYEALREINSRSFDAYVLEMWLPDLSGLQLCREIRKLDPHGAVVFCTAAVRIDDRNRAFRAGASAYLCKPIDARRLQGEVRVLVELAQIESLRARVEEQQAVQEELQRLTSENIKRAHLAKAAANCAMERTSRVKALRAFIDSGGTRANFDRWWDVLFPPMFADAWSSCDPECAARSLARNIPGRALESDAR